MKTWFRRAILARPWAAFLVLALSFLLFGAGTLDLLHLFEANFQLLVSYGWQAAMDGGLRQLGELVVTGLLSMAAYVVFKTCEHALIDYLRGGAHDAVPAAAPPPAPHDHGDAPQQEAAALDPGTDATGSAAS